MSSQTATITKRKPTAAGPVKQNRWSEQTRRLTLNLLEANAGNFTQTSLSTGVPESTIRAWKQGKGRPFELEDSATKKVISNLADRCEQIAWMLLDAIVGKIGHANLSQTSTSFGILVDKMRLLREQPPPASEAEKTASESLARCAEALVALATQNGQALTLPQAQAKIREIQLREAKITFENRSQEVSATG